MSSDQDNSREVLILCCRVNAKPCAFK